MWMKMSALDNLGCIKYQLLRTTYRLEYTKSMEMKL